MTITIKTTTSDNIAVISPYNADFVAGARRLAGKWGSVTSPTGTDKAWLFPVEVTADVKALLREVYGEDGSSEVPTVRLRVTYDRSLDDGNAGSVVIGGREVAFVFGRDSGARLGNNIVIRTGGFRSGGSRKNYRVDVKDDTVIDMLRMPRAMADRLVADHPTLCLIVADDGSDLGSEQTDNVVSIR